MIAPLVLVAALSLPADLPASAPAAGPSRSRIAGIVLGAATAAAGVAGLCGTVVLAPVSALVMYFVVQQRGEGDPRVFSYVPATKWDDDREKWAWANSYRLGFYGVLAAIALGVLSVVLVATGAGTALSWALGGEEVGP